LSQFQTAFARLDEFIKQKMGATNTPGLSIALTDRDKTLQVACYGDANMAAGLPVKPETLFEIGSIGKSFTSIALLQLYETGRIDLYAPVSQYLPWFEVQTKYAPITLHDLMTHTSGIINGKALRGSGLLPRVYAVNRCPIR
jgi:D-alanyl-D-alanine carboxypeptidase